MSHFRPIRVLDLCYVLELVGTRVAGQSIISADTFDGFLRFGGAICESLKRSNTLFRQRSREC